MDVKVVCLPSFLCHIFHSTKNVLPLNHTAFVFVQFIYSVVYRQCLYVCQAAPNERRIEMINNLRGGFKLEKSYMTHTDSTTNTTDHIFRLAICCSTRAVVADLKLESRVISSNHATGQTLTYSIKEPQSS